MPPPTPSTPATSRWKALGRFSNAASSFQSAEAQQQESAADRRAAEDPDAPTRGDLNRAYAASLLRRCVKKTVVTRDTVPTAQQPLLVDPTGIRVQVERFRPFSVPFQRMHEFGCPVSVTLYLHFVLEAALAFLLMAVVALPTTIDAWLRNVRRLECRSLVQKANRTAIDAARLATCGYDGVALRASLPLREPFLYVYLLPALGTCTEYATSTENVTTSQVTTPGAFVDLDSSADFCADGDAGITGGLRGGGLLLAWSFALNVLIFGLYLMRVRRMQVVHDAAFVKETLTAADFAVMIKGLEHVPYDDDGTNHVPEIERRLRADLQRLGFDGEDVDHIELGRDCGRELRQLQKLAALRTRREELRFKRALMQERHEGEEEAEAAKVRGALVDAPAADVQADVQAPPRDGGGRGSGGGDDDASLSFSQPNDAEVGGSVHSTSGHIATKATKLADRAAERRERERAAIQEAFDKVAKATSACRQELRRLRSETHITTGHAFVVFQRIRDRDRFLNVFNPAPKAIGDGGLADKYAEMIIRLCGGPLCGGGRCGGRISALISNREAEVRRGPELQAAGWRHVHVSRAPEPDDIFWENLELKPHARRERQRLSYMLLALIILIGLLMMGAARIIQVSYHQNSALYFTSADGYVPTRRLLGNLTISGVAAGVTLLFNLLVRPASFALTDRESHPTRSASEKSSFTKLILAYSLNTVVVPIFVAFISYDHPYGQSATLTFSPRITQAWYESGGVVSQAVILILSNAVVTDFNKVVQILPLFDRYMRAPLFARSQIKLNELWAPPRMEIGDTYAETFRTLLLGLVYAPIYPPAFVLTALALLSTFYSTKVSIAYWFMRPASVDGKLMKRMRNACQWLLLACIAIVCFTLIGALSKRARQGNYTLSTHTVPALIISILLWCCVLCAGPITSRTAYFSTRFQSDIFTVATDMRLSQTAQQNVRRADRMRYDHVTKELGYMIERYECPAASKAKSTKHLEQAAFRQGFRGGFVDAGIATLLEPQPTDGLAESSGATAQGGVPVGAPAALAALARWGSSKKKKRRVKKKGRTKLSWASASHINFEAVALPAPPKPLEEALISTWTAPDATPGRRQRKSLAKRAEARGARRTRSTDAVIVHLDGAMEALNQVMTELGGEPVDVEQTGRTNTRDEVVEPALFARVDAFPRPDKR